jgi:hypothetical protein
MINIKGVKGAPSLAPHSFLSGEQIATAELMFLEESTPSRRTQLRKEFCGQTVVCSKQLSARDLAPFLKIFSIRDIFLGSLNSKGPAEIGLRVSLEDETAVNILMSTSSCWLTVISPTEKKTMPLDRHTAYLLREAVEKAQPIRKKRFQQVGVLPHALSQFANKFKFLRKRDIR